jgi:hypothetical protein
LQQGPGEAYPSLAQGREPPVAAAPERAGLWPAVAPRHSASARG